MKKLSSCAQNGARVFVLATLALCATPIWAAPPEGTDLELGGSGADAGKFADLRDMAFDGQNILLTLEGPKETGDRDKKYAGNMRVQRFDRLGKPIGQFSIADAALAADPKPGRNGEPAHIAGDDKGNIYVSFPGRDIVRKFSSTGAKLADFPVPAANALTRYIAGGRERIAVTGGAQQVVNGKWANVGGEAITLIENDKTETVPLAVPVAQVADMTADKAGNFYLVAATNAIWKFAPDGKLLKTLGAQTNVNAEEGSELKHSVAVDSKGNVYAQANSFLSRFDANFQTVTQREVRYNWFEPSGWKMLAIDSDDRIWAATPDLVTHQLFERFHFRPAIVRAEPSYFNADEKGVRTASALGIGLKADIANGEFGVAYDLKPFPFELVVAPANRNVKTVGVEYRIFDVHRNKVGGGKFDMALEDGKEVRAPLAFTPPRYGWYTADVSISSGTQELFRIGKHGGATQIYPGMPKLVSIPGLGSTNDVPRHKFTGLTNMRLNVGAKAREAKDFADVDKVVAASAEYGTTAFIQFTDEAATTPEAVRAAVTHFKGRVKYWEIINEPNLRMSAEKYFAILKMASTIIREVDPAAKVMGPATVNIDLSYIDALYKLGLKEQIDILSLHDYEGHEGIDPVHWRYKFGELRKVMARYGDEKKEIWQTERVLAALRGGTFRGLDQAVRLAQHRDLLETLGIKPEHNNHFYLIQSGFAPVPSYIWGSNGPYPAAFSLRTRYAMTQGRKYAGTHDFGTQGNAMFSALRYVGADGETVVLRNEGTLPQPLTISASGTALEIVDSWGNSSRVPIRNGAAELQVEQLPMYLRLSPGQKISVPRMDWGQNLAQRAQITYSARSERPMRLLNNGVIETIHAGSPTGGTDGSNIWTGDLPEIGEKIAPQTLELSFDSAKTFDKIVLNGVRPDNQFTSLRDYSLEAFDGAKWTVLDAVKEPFPASDPVSTPPNFATSWDDETFLWVHRLAKPVTASKLRLTVRRTTFGFAPDALASAAVKKTWGGQNKQRFMLREIEVYAPGSTVEIAATVAQPQKTAVFAPEDAAVSFRNTSKTAFAGTAKMTAPAGWKVEPAQIALKLAPGATQNMKVRVSPAGQLSIGAAFVDVAVQNAAGKSAGSGWLRYDLASPLEFVPGGAKNIGTAAQVLTATVKNITTAPLSGVAKLEVAGQNLEQPFGPIEAGKSAEVSFPVPDLKLAGALLTANYAVTANNLQLSATQPLGVREWNVIGTWPKEFDKPFGPEPEVGKIDVAKNFTDGMGQEQKWKIFASEPSGYLNLLPLQPNQNVTAYALIYVTSPTARRAIFAAGTDDGGKAWLNGKEVFVDSAAHDSAPGQVKVPVQLKAGRNEVLYKIVQGGFNMGLHFELLDETAKPMTDLTYSPRP